MVQVFGRKIFETDGAPRNTDKKTKARSPNPTPLSWRITSSPKPMDAPAIQALLDSILAPWVRELALTPESVTEDAVTLRLPHADHLRHAGGVVCGQVFMAAADTAMVVAISHALGGFQPMTTVSLNTTFMRPVKQGDVLVTASVQRRGRNLVFGEIELRDDKGALAAHATTTYALINQ
jgi:uncharacterized protein (TIGR00369 family)